MESRWEPDLCLSAYRLRKDKTLCETDVIFVCNDREFAAHKDIMASCSPYFEAMFHSGFRETEASMVPLPGVEAHIMEIILEGIYSHKFRDLDNDLDCIFNVLDATHFMNIDSIFRVYREILLKNLTLDTVLSIWDAAEKYDDQEMLSAVQAFVNSNLTPPFQFDFILNLTPHRVIPVLQFAIDKEIFYPIEILKRIVEWVNYDYESRIAYLPDFLPLVEFDKVPSYFLRYLMNKEELTKKSEDLHNYIICILCKRNGNDPADFINLHENIGFIYPRYTRLLLHEVRVSRLQFEPGDTTRLEEEDGFFLTKTPFDINCNSVFVTHGKRVYVILNHEEKLRVWFFDLLGLRWTLRPSEIPQQFCYAEMSAVVIRGLIHVFGRDSPESSKICRLMLYDPESDKWTMEAVCDLQHELGIVRLVAVDDTPYLLLIKRVEYQLILECSSYDYTTKKFKVESELTPILPYYYTAQSAGGKLFIRMYLRNPQRNIWIICDIKRKEWTMMFRRGDTDVPDDPMTSVYDFCGRKDVLWAIATDDPQERNHRLFAYHVPTNRWKQISVKPFPLSVQMLAVDLESLE